MILYYERLNEIKKHMIGMKSILLVFIIKEEEGNSIQYFVGYCWSGA